MIMGTMRRLVLDTLKPYEPGIIEMADQISDLAGVSAVNINIYEMDRKVDDGQANTGRMQLGQGGTGWAAANAALCLNGAGTGYAVLADPGDCAVVFRNF